MINSVDVCWHPVDKNIVATAAYNGKIYIWNLLRANQRIDHVLSYHERTVKRVIFDPHNPNILLSGCNDGKYCVRVCPSRIASSITNNFRDQDVINRNESN